MSIVGYDVRMWVIHLHWILYCWHGPKSCSSYRLSGETLSISVMRFPWLPHASTMLRVTISVGLICIHLRYKQLVFDLIFLFHNSI